MIVGVGVDLSILMVAMMISKFICEDISLSIRKSYPVLKLDQCQMKCDLLVCPVGALGNCGSAYKTHMQ